MPEDKTIYIVGGIALVGILYLLRCQLFGIDCPPPPEGRAELVDWYLSV